MRVEFELPEDTYRQVCLHARDQGRAVSDVITDLVARAVEARVVPAHPVHPVTGFPQLSIGNPAKTWTAAEIAQMITEE